jgi:hypothetical protein
MIGPDERDATQVTVIERIDRNGYARRIWPDGTYETLGQVAFVIDAAPAQPVEGE